TGAGNAGKFLHVIVPGGQVFIADWPVNGDALAQVGFKILRAQAIALTPPQERAAAHVITAIPVEALLLYVGAILFVGPHALSFLIEHKVALQHWMVALHFLGG